MRIVGLTAENVKRLRLVEVHPDPDGNLVVVAGRNAQGKAQPLSEPVLTPAGWRPMGDLVPGDHVIGGDGKPATIISVHPQTGREVWKVTFSDGSWTRCSPDHLWSVSKWKSRRPRVDERRHGETRRTAKPISTKVARVASLAQLVDIGLEANAGGPGRWQIPLVAGPVWFEQTTADLPIDPYVLGVILGDGHITSRGDVKFSTDDDIIRRLGLIPRRPPSLRSDAIATAATSRWRQPLADLGLAGRHSWDKFVPEAYLWSDIDSRAALLAGLLDTDGHPQAVGAVEFASTSEALIDAVVHLTLSLGGRARKSGPRVTRYTHGGEKRDGRPSWRVRVHTSFNPFALARKADRWSEPPQRETARWIVSAERVEDEDCQCIRIDAADGLYVTRNFVVTHNSSLLDSIMYALGGGGVMRDVDRPIRDGASKASVRVDLGDLIVERTWTAAGGTSLKVSSPGGARQQSPQALLDSFVGKLAFDPLAFTRMPPREQVAALLSVAAVEFDPDEWAGRRRARYDERTEANREVARLVSLIDAIPADPDAPTEVESMSDLIDRLGDVDGRIAHHRAAWAEVDRLRAEYQAADAEWERLRAATNDALTRRTETFNALTSMEVSLRQEDVDAQQLADERAELARRMSEVEATNERVRQARERANLVERHELFKSTSEDLTRQIDALDTERSDLLAAAELPVPGLSFDDNGVTYNGVPFAQVSAAERLRVSAAMAMAANPNLRIVLVRDAAVLDDESMAVLAELAEQHDTQVWVEVIESDHPTVVIEDGTVAEQGGNDDGTSG